MNNIRRATQTENQRNKQKRTTPTTSKYIGECWDKHCEKWKAQIQINKKSIHLGRFDDPKEAAIAYNQGVTGLATEYGVLNEISDNED